MFFSYKICFYYIFTYNSMFFLIKYAFITSLLIFQCFIKYAFITFLLIIQCFFPYKICFYYIFTYISMFFLIKYAFIISLLIIQCFFLIKYAFITYLLIFQCFFYKICFWYKFDENEGESKYCCLSMVTKIITFFQIFSLI